MGFMTELLNLNVIDIMLLVGGTDPTGASL
jgi:hypothetical protein